MGCRMLACWALLAGLGILAAGAATALSLARCFQHPQSGHPPVKHGLEITTCEETHSEGAAPAQSKALWVEPRAFQV